MDAVGLAVVRAVVVLAVEDPQDHAIGGCVHVDSLEHAFETDGVSISS
jgi:hypothetical protein